MLNSTATATTNSLEHVHHWLIAEVEGPTSEGLCRGCGIRRVFRNWPNEAVLQKAEYAAA